MSNHKVLSSSISGQNTLDGAGVKLTRIIGSEQLNMLDPFLLLDFFKSDEPNDYIAGFPSHPHRGFETVTYMLAGRMGHKDNAGNSGIIEAGGVQWMTAGKGIVHSELPEQECGSLSGFQLWVNLPRSKKMIEPRYQEFLPSEIPIDNYKDIIVKVITGKTKSGTEGVVRSGHVDPIFWDVHHVKRSKFNENISSTKNAFIYVYEGKISLAQSNQSLFTGQLGILTGGSLLEVSSEESAKYLIVAGEPLNEPVARGGPFVMNTRDEIDQAFRDYRNGRF